jgi:hypothetical protein
MFMEFLLGLPSGKCNSAVGWLFPFPSHLKSGTEQTHEQPTKKNVRMFRGPSALLIVIEIAD